MHPFDAGSLFGHKGTALAPVGRVMEDAPDTRWSPRGRMARGGDLRNVQLVCQCPYGTARRDVLIHMQQDRRILRMRTQANLEWLVFAGLTDGVFYPLEAKRRVMSRHKLTTL